MSQALAPVFPSCTYHSRHIVVVVVVVIVVVSVVSRIVYYIVKDISIEKKL